MYVVYVRMLSRQAGLCLHRFPGPPSCILTRQQQNCTSCFNIHRGIIAKSGDSDAVKEQKLQEFIGILKQKGYFQGVEEGSAGMRYVRAPVSASASPVVGFVVLFSLADLVAGRLAGSFPPGAVTPTRSCRRRSRCVLRVCCRISIWPSRLGARVICTCSCYQPAVSGS